MEPLCATYFIGGSCRGGGGLPPLLATTLAPPLPLTIVCWGIWEGSYVEADGVTGVLANCSAYLASCLLPPVVHGHF